MLSKPSDQNAVKEISVSITPAYLMWVAAIGLLLILCAVLIASYTIIRLKPRDILSKMS
jgi:putative ABC transport system permease protein